MTESEGPLPAQPQLAVKATHRGPTVSILTRFGLAIGLALINWLLVVVESGGYTDSADGHVSVSDALYYTTVTLTTTGYGDITPVTHSARLANALLVTPMRLIFVVLLVGTTIKALTRQSRNEFRLRPHMPGSPAYADRPPMSMRCDRHSSTGRGLPLSPSDVTTRRSLPP